MLSFLIKRAGKWKWLLYISILATLLGTLFSFLLPQVIRVTVDSVIDSKPYDLPAALAGFLDAHWSREYLQGHLYIPAIFAAALAVLSGVMNYLRRYEAGRFAEGYVKELRDALYARISRLPFSWHIKVQTGDIVQRCTSDIETIRGFLSMQLVELARVVIMVATAAAMMLTINVRLTLITLVFIPVITGYSVYFFAKASERFKKADEAEGVLMTAVQENLTGVRVVRAFGREAYEFDKFNRANDAFSQLWLKLGDVLSIFWGFGDFVTGMQNAIILLLGVTYVVNGNGLTLGGLIAFMSYNAQITWPIRALGRILSEMSRAGVSVARIRDILEEPPETDPIDALRPELNGELEFKDVTFSYGDGEPVLRDVSFKVPVGQTLAILGTTGSGKSSIAHLLARLYDLPEGSGVILVDGIDIRQIARDCLRRQVGLVLQEPFLFSRSIFENIRAARDLTPEQVRDCAAIAAVDEAIQSFDKGYDTVVGERGVTLSGGQKQRVAIARMLAQEPAVMIFDDSLSAVDTGTDAKIREALSSRLGKKTTILISHRATTLMQADYIIVLDGGRIVERGTHAELMKMSGMYSRVVALQNSLEEDVTGEVTAR
ncbi:MAG TPA: ABC transporter ATP-binding protein [Candidatus Acidoferrum sp.]|nr:ABC transporter ATP-binding protein [Candidatus Acidoferrum sp.]